MMNGATLISPSRLRMPMHCVIADGEAMPPPSSLDVITADEHNGDAIGFLVDLPARPRPNHLSHAGPAAGRRAPRPPPGAPAEPWFSSDDARAACRRRASGCPPAVP